MAASVHSRCVAVSYPRVGNTSSVITWPCLASGSPQLPSSCSSFRSLPLISLPLLHSLRLPSAAPSAFPRSAQIRLWRSSQGWDGETSEFGGAYNSSSAFNGGGYSEDERNVTRTVDQLMERFESLQQQRERGAGGAAIGGGVTRFEMDDDEVEEEGGGDDLEELEEGVLDVIVGESDYEEEDEEDEEEEEEVEEEEGEEEEGEGMGMEGMSMSERVHQLQMRVQQAQYATDAGAAAAGAVITARDLARLFDHPIDKFQRVAIEAFLRGSSVVVCAPTSSGKTLVGEAAAAATMARGGRLIYTTPLKALSNQKLRDFRCSAGYYCAVLPRLHSHSVCCASRL
ncbi:unnamed protein product [Closterium sp. NIES-54]